MKKIYSTCIILLVSLISYSQVTASQLTGTWALCAINGNDDSTLVIVYRDDFEWQKFFKHHAINKVWELRDTSKHNYKTEFSRSQLTDEMLVSWLGGMENLFYQFDMKFRFKENSATDSLFTKEEVQDASLFESINNKKIPGYKLSGDTLYFTRPMQGNSLLVGFYVVKFKEGYLVLNDIAGTTWYFKRISNTPLFKFDPKF